VPHRAETQSTGRHRRDAQRRDLFASERARAVLLTAALGTALAMGVAGGTAAAAAQRHTATGSAPTGSTPTGSTPTGSAPTGSAPTGSALVGSALVGSTVQQEPAVIPPAQVVAAAPRAAINLAAEPVRKKSRSAAKKARLVAKKARAAAWVNPNPTAYVSSCFGQRWGRLHAGVDMAGPNGTPIVAAGAGVVVRAGEASGYGNAVLIDHGNGYLTHYGHLSAITVQVGQQVAAGQQIGDEGSTGHSTGPHLHFEVHQGFYQNPIEPTRWMHEHGVDILGCDTF
jgi:murein DD-endopeptidase MepM/ murein hydrolase activator NlpD